jgi:hypothetical protein
LVGTLIGRIRPAVFGVAISKDIDQGNRFEVVPLEFTEPFQHGWVRVGLGGPGGELRNEDDVLGPIADYFADHVVLHGFRIEVPLGKRVGVDIASGGAAMAIEIQLGF